MSQFALEITDLKKIYDSDVVALKGINLSVKEGDFFALLGPNGAGKSSTIGIIASLVTKTAGKVKIFGIDTDENFPEAKRLLGVVSQEINFNNFEKVIDIVTTQAGFYGISLKDSKLKTETTLKRLGLWEKRNEQARTLSGGFKRRLMIAKVGGEGGNKKAVKVWEQRQFQNLDDSVEIGTRNIKVALRRLRKFARQSTDYELDMDGTIKSTARNAGILDINMIPERTNHVKVLIFFDVGGSMDPYIKICEELFSALKTEFKHLKYFYFHNCVYESVWEDNRRRTQERFLVQDIINKYSADYKVIFVGDATMAPYEITNAGGSIEHWNEEPGGATIRRLCDHFDRVAWLNPVPDDHWDYTSSLCIIRELVDNRMFPLTLKGLEEGMSELSK